MTPEPSESTKFFEFGEVTFEERDFPSRQAAIRICMPCCLFEAVTPSLLGAGVIDQYRVREPMAVWMPKFSTERMHPNAEQLLDNSLERLNMTLRATSENTLEIFRNLSYLVADPSDLVPLLPLGTYITFRLRCRIDDIPKVLFGVQNTPVNGVAEFQWALASVLACVLEDIQKWEASKQLQP
jgi:hypothetical protein